MTTTKTHPVEQSQAGGNLGHCTGCPRCQDANAPWCPSSHPETPGVHPLCKLCGHCVLRGSHADDAEDVRSGKFAGRKDYLN